MTAVSSVVVRVWQIRWKEAQSLTITGSVLVGLKKTPVKWQGKGRKKSSNGVARSLNTAVNDCHSPANV